MPEQIDKILTDIYALNPELFARDAEVRVIVAALLTAKPAVQPREEFVRSLRAKLLSPQSQSARATVGTSWLKSPYLQYLAPLGAVAVLIFMLLPAPLSYQPLPPAEPVSNDNVESVSEDTADSVESRMFMVPAGGEMSPTVETEMKMMDTGMSELSFPTVPTNSLIVEPQRVGARVVVAHTYFTEPTILVVRSEEPEASRVLGVSQPQSGEQSNLYIPLFESLLREKTYVVSAYVDTNADGIFTPELDVPVLDSQGYPLESYFETW